MKRYFSRSLHPEVAEGPVEVKKIWEQITLGVFLVLPLLALIAAVPVLWGWGLTWRDVVIAAVMYAITGHGVTVGFHRHFTHHAFRAKRWLRVTLAVAGSMAIQGPVIRWVADHRKHHRFSDRDGDPHSPWRYGTSLRALTKGFFYSHVGWLFDWEQTSAEKFAPDLCRDRPSAGCRRPSPSGWSSRCCSRRWSAGCGPGRGRAPSPPSSGAAWSGSPCCTTSPSPSTRCATSPDAGRSRPGTRAATCGGWPSRPWASRGTTSTTPSRPRPATAWAASRSTPAPWSSGSWRSCAGSTTCAGPTPASSPAAAWWSPTRRLTAGPAQVRPARDSGARRRAKSGRSGIPASPPSVRTASTWCSSIRRCSKPSRDPAR